MNNLKVSYFTYNLPFRYPFTISKGTKTHQPVFIAELEWRGFRGYGEAPAITYYHIPVEKMLADLEQKKAFVEKFAFTEPERYWHYLHHLFPENSFLVCALDMAAWDLFGKINGKSLHDLWRVSGNPAIITDYTIGIDSIDRMVARIKERPWPVYKIKVGIPGDVENVQALRKHTNAVFRVDANAGWSLEEALIKIPRLKDLGVELIEQPLEKDNWEGMKILYHKSPLPVIADESCVKESDVKKCHGHFHGINIKLTKCSGITPALRMIREARQLGMSTMLGCMNESSIGTAALVHLSGMADFLDADGPLLLAEDIATGITYENGKVEVSPAPGLGIDFTGRR